MQHARHRHRFGQKLLRFQRSEITEYEVYRRLAHQEKNAHNKKVLQRIAEDERGHAHFWKDFTKKEIHPNWWKVRLFTWIAKILGLTFGVRLMERGEEQAQKDYKEILKEIPQAEKVLEDEKRHEQELIECLNERKLQYVGSVVLGLNDALVELTGALAGLTFALQNTKLIAIVGLITGIAASFSMAASEYLSTKSEGQTEKNAGTSAIYTGLAYIITVLLLILPYLLQPDYFLALALMLAVALFIIFAFNFYISVAKNEPFFKRFFEMAGISLGVAALSFGIGIVVRMWLGVDV
ncbi:VIT1/CCC1 transporter family protein [Candidatus Gracilibacteria bacterium]|nr:VIT1/CCC1 transporter family protein [Candidatus Gracilibacteria bacterium]